MSCLDFLLSIIIVKLPLMCLCNNKTSVYLTTIISGSQLLFSFISLITHFNSMNKAIFLIPSSQRSKLRFRGNVFISCVWGEKPGSKFTLVWLQHHALIHCKTSSDHFSLSYRNVLKLSLWISSTSYQFLHHISSLPQKSSGHTLLREVDQFFQSLQLLSNYASACLLSWPSEPKFVFMT